MKIRFKVFPFIPPVHFFLNFSSFSSFLEPYPLLLPPSSKSFLCIYQGSLLPYHPTTGTIVPSPFHPLPCSISSSSCSCAPLFLGKTSRSKRDVFQKSFRGRGRLVLLYASLARLHFEKHRQKHQRRCFFLLKKHCQNIALV